MYEECFEKSVHEGINDKIDLTPQAMDPMRIFEVEIWGLEA